MAWDVEMAKMLKERENITPIGNIVGKVISGLPNIKIAILDDNITLYQEKLYCCNSLLNYSKQGNIAFTTNTEKAQEHSHNINVNTNCDITFSNSLSVGDEVLLMHNADGTKWFIVDKIVKL